MEGKVLARSPGSDAGRGTGKGEGCRTRRTIRSRGCTSFLHRMDEQSCILP